MEEKYKISKMKSLYRAFLSVMLLACLLAFLQSCKPSIPSQYLSKSEMEDILYDIHIAEAMADLESGPSENANMIAYREAIFKKHGITSAEFDSSMVYYMRHTKLLHDVYLRLGDRLTAEAHSLGADVSDANLYGNIASGDTANVWNGAKCYVFSAGSPFNHASFEIPVDSGFHKGDRLIFDFDAQFIFQEGVRDGIAVVAITLGNDSVVSGNVRIYNSQHYSLQLDDADSLGIKSIKGYFLLNKGDYGSGNSSFTTLKLMFVQNIKLVRLHPKRESVVKKSSDSISNNEPRPVLSAPLSTPNRRAIPPQRLEKMEILRDDKVQMHQK